LADVLFNADNQRPCGLEYLHSGTHHGQHPVGVVILRDSSVCILSLLGIWRRENEQVSELSIATVKFRQSRNTITMNNCVKSHGG
jgi:hypothetical protein